MGAKLAALEEAGKEEYRSIGRGIVSADIDSFLLKKEERSTQKILLRSYRQSIPIFSGFARTKTPEKY